MIHTAELRDKDDMIVFNGGVESEDEIPPVLLHRDGRYFVYSVTTDPHPGIDTQVVNLYREQIPVSI